MAKFAKNCFSSILEIYSPSNYSIGEIVQLGETYPSSAAQWLKSINGKEPGAPGKSVENEKNGGNPEQVIIIMQ